MAETRISSSQAFLKAVHAEACANWHLSTYPTAGDIGWHIELLFNSGYKKLTKYEDYSLLFMLSLLCYSLKSTRTNLESDVPSTNQVNCANWPAYAKNLPFKLELIGCKLDKMNKQLNSTSLEF